MSQTETATPQPDATDEVIDPAVEVLSPQVQTAPLVCASPHSGRIYPERFKARARLDALTLRNSEDAFVDELYAAGPGLGVPLLKANFPRAYVDPNREPYELDPDMFTDPLPAYANTRSRRVRGGLGTIARVVTNGREIYAGKLPFAEAETPAEALLLPLSPHLAQSAGRHAREVRGRSADRLSLHALDRRANGSRPGLVTGGFRARRSLWRQLRPRCHRSC